MDQKLNNPTNPLYNLIPIKNQEFENSDNAKMALIELASFFTLDVTSNDKGVMLKFNEKHDKSTLNGILDNLKNVKIDDKVSIPKSYAIASNTKNTKTNAANVNQKRIEAFFNAKNARAQMPQQPPRYLNYTNDYSGYNNVNYEYALLNFNK